MDIIERLTQHLQLFPGVGPRTARRYIYHLLGEPKGRIEELAGLLSLLLKEIQNCPRCFNFSSENICSLCASLHRDQSLLCIVSRPQEIESMEKAEEYHGLYFVLGGLLNPLLGIDPKHLRFRELMERMKNNPVKLEEILFAMNPTLEGENTIHYLKKILKPTGIKMTVLARGIPQGADLEYADEITLGEAIRQRREV